MQQYLDNWLTDGDEVVTRSSPQKHYFSASVLISASG
jgi:hypothetical protein